MADSIPEATSLATAWLKGEHDYQFAGQRRIHKTDPARSAAYILTRELPDRWQRFQFFRREAAFNPDSWLVLSLHAGQNIMKACAAARAALVWTRVADGIAFETANNRTWDDLEAHYATLRAQEGMIPSSVVLDAPFATAVDVYDQTETIFPEAEVLPAFQRMSSLALSHLVDQQVGTGAIELPVPGRPNGDIQLWQPGSV